MALSESQLAEFENQLKAWRKELQDAHNKVLHDMQEDPGNYADPNDQATMEAERDFEIRIKGRERFLIRKIDQALTRIREGEYGICDSCGTDISYKRLKARPVTTLCIECKIEQEQGERTHN